MVLYFRNLTRSREDSFLEIVCKHSRAIPSLIGSTMEADSITMNRCDCPEGLEELYGDKKYGDSREDRQNRRYEPNSQNRSIAGVRQLQESRG
jgi:hypothetical protein